MGRVSACRPAAGDSEGRPRGDVAVFTPAMPTAIRTARALGATLLNTSYTVLLPRADETLLLTFNAVPHLGSPELRTRR